MKTNEFDNIFTNTFDTAQRNSGGFLNEFYDDEGWWALAWLDVYSLRGGNAYLQMSKSIFADMTGGWSDNCGGGVWWKKNEHYKNAVANELFLSVAVRLALLSHGKARADYLLGLLTPKGVTQHLTDVNGVIHDPCEPDCGADGVHFKGILMRNLLPLLAISPSAELLTLVQQNAESVWTHARTPASMFSANWAGLPADSGTGSLISALDSLITVLPLTPQATSRHLR